MPTVGLLINETKPAALDWARRLTDALRERGDVTVRTRAMLADQLESNCSPASDQEIAEESDFVVVFGGDGTLLSAARLVAPWGTPILGVHLGRFGFITEAPPESLMTGVEMALEGRYKIEERTMLTGTVRRANAPDPDAPPDDCDVIVGMNDVVVASNAVRMVHVETRIGEQTFATYAADGVIVASPTGSTGYSLSAGGPLVHPSAPVFIITPICPHTLNARTLIVPDTETVHLTIAGATRDTALVSVDGQIEVPLRAGDTVSVARAPYKAKLLSIGGPNFYQKVREKWGYGERVAT